MRPVSVLESVSERKAGRLADFGVESVLDLVTTYPRRYIDRTRQADVSGLEVGDEAAVLASVQSARSRRARNGRAVVDLVVRDETGRLAVVFFNQPWRAKQLEAGTEAIFFGKVGEYRGTRQMVNPVVDVVAGVTPGRRTLRILPVYPASAKAGLTSWEIGECVEEALGRAGDFVDPLPAAWRVVARPVGPDRGLRGHPPARVVRRGRARPAPPGLRRAVPPAARPGAAAAGLRGQRARPAPRRVAAGDHRRRRRHPGGALPGPPALRAHQGAAPGPGRHRGRHGRPLPHAPPPPGRRRLGQDRGRAGRAARRGAERAPGRPDGADRGAGRAALLGRARAARRPRGAGRDGRRRGAGGAAHEPGEGQGAHRGAGGAGGGRGRPRGRDPRAVDRGGRVRLARRGRDRRAAPLRRRAAGDAARQGRRRRPGPPGHDGDADPAHGRHGDLRRPRPDHARRAAAGPDRRRRPSGCPGDAHGGAGAGLGPGAPGGGGRPPRLRRLPARLATRSGSRPSRPPRSSSGWRRASWRACASGSCTGRWRRRRARRSWTASARASSRCSSPRP